MSGKARILTLFVSLVPAALSVQVLPAQEKRIALTFEEMPYMKPLGFWRPREVSSLILRALEAEKILAAGFIVEEKIETDTSSYVIIGDWVTRGHVLGNQTWGDADYNVLTYDQFMEHVVDGQKSLRRVSKAQNFNYRYLRFPQLHEGNEKRKKEKILKTLSRADYRVAHVTVKTVDWVFNEKYLEVETNREAVETLKAQYLEHIGACLDYAEKQSEAVFGGHISQILQLRAGIATASFLPDLIQMLQERGYSFVSFPDALEDEAYQTEETYIGPLGLSFIDRVAFTRGLPFDENSGAPEAGELRRQLR